MRSFIAIDLSPSIKASINDFIQQNNVKKYFSGIRWIKFHNLHITLAFLGEISIDEVSTVKKILENISLKHMSFPIELSGFGFFPNFKNPKVLWIGIKEQPELMTLKQDIDMGLDTFNIFYDKKPFSPHLTIGRIKPPLKFKPEIAETLDFKASFLVTEIHLMKSDLLPGGPVYTDLYNVKFG
ncbi:MAG TPA: RNA 2',3'-cyclic phosphodiesterase [Thermoanaerobacterales bacterium]|nr:RNA 2',3'-cyclic phosphodiesterase [Thermoanaerobacterales bacterium]